MRVSADTICAIATPPGEGAIGVVRLSGPDALRLLSQLTNIEQHEPRKMRVSVIRDPWTQEPLDEAMVCAMPGPRSYTGEDVVELQAHGGQLNMEQLLALCLKCGARQAEPGEFTRRAFVNGRMDLTQAEAVAEVIAARSGAALRNAQALLGGQLGRRVRALRDDAIRLGADLEACLDFAEDLEQPVSQRRLADQHTQLIATLERLVGSYAQGRRLNGVSVALVGRVNAGKSSLLNALHGTRRALVSDEAGTTRDYLEVELAWGGLNVTLVDTAGARRAEQMSALEQAGHALGSARVATCDAVVLVVDVSQPSDAAVLEEMALEQVSLLAAHKADLLPPGELQARCEQLAQRTGKPVVGTSATSGLGLGQLEQALLQQLTPVGWHEQRESVQVTQARQHGALCRALDALRAGKVALEGQLPPELVVEHTREALEALGEVTGESYTEALLDSVFARFCVGK